MLNDKKKILVSTGNILSVNKKAGQKTNEEVSKIRQHFLKTQKYDFCSIFVIFLFVIEILFLNLNIFVLELIGLTLWNEILGQIIKYSVE